MVSTKDRILEASSELFRRQGYSATGVKQIVAAASAPFGSIYHFFPGGKAELGEDVIRRGGAHYGQLIDVFFAPEPDPVKATQAFFSAAAQTLRDTNYADACPIATVALEVASTNEALRRATADVFDSWTARTAEYLTRTGISSGTAKDVAVVVIALLEGAFILARASRNAEPVIVAGAAAAAAVRAALPSGMPNPLVP